MNMLNLLFPPQCVGCSTSGSYLCDTCLSQLQTHSEICPYCHGYSQQGVTCRDCHQLYSNGMDGLIVGFCYHRVIRQAILKLKYYHVTALAQSLASQLSLHLMSHQRYKRMDQIAITHVPNHRRRRRMIKGYNQSAQLAEHVATMLDVPHVSLATRVKHTPQQTTLSKDKRWENLVNAFGGLHTSLPKYTKTIIIVDDVTTTGSTLHHLTTHIKQKYPDVQVRGLVLARQGR